MLRLVLPAALCGFMLGGAALPAAAVPDGVAVPLPQANPLGPRPASAAGPAAAQAAAPTTAAVTPVATPADPATLLRNVSQYFNSIRTMQGEFIQFGPNGEQSEGVFFISRPGKLRFHYRPPVHVDVIADGRSVAVRDKSVGTQDLYPLSRTPLRHLLSDQIDLASSNIVSDVVSEPDLVALVIGEERAFDGGKLTLIFDNQSYELRQWIVTDAQGLETSVAVYNVETGMPVDPSIFNIYVSRDSLGHRQ